jgi:hypothetical protein
LEREAEALAGGSQLFCPLASAAAPDGIARIWGMA